MTIVPIKDLKDTVKIEHLCSKENGPVFITKNGYGKLVVMDIKYYEKIMNQAIEAREINRGIEDLKNGKVIEGNLVMEKAKEKYGF